MGTTATMVGPATRGGVADIESVIPYRVAISLRGTSDILFHRWVCEAVKVKADAAKGSKAKKTDNLEDYVFRNADRQLCLPGEYLRGSIINAAKFRQDPRSPRKSAMDLFKAAVVSLTEMAPLGPEPTTEWQYAHQCRVTVQRAGITRTRPAFRAGWTAELVMMVTLPHYVSPALLHDVVSEAGRVVGVGDFRPTYGRFAVDKYEVLQD